MQHASSHPAAPADPAAGGGDFAAPSAPAEALRITHEGERLALLRQLHEQALPLTLQSPDGHTLRATLWSVDAVAGRLAFALPSETPAADRLVEGNEATATAFPEQVKLQFELDDMVLVRSAERTTLQSALPTEMLRLQRRASFRVTLARGTAPLVHLRHPAIPEMRLTLRMLDVSMGGCALWLPDDVPTLQVGSTWADARVELDPTTTLRAALTLQYLTAPLPGTSGVRGGCGWQLPRPEDQRTLQRWIDHAQKRQRLLAKAGGAAD